MDEAENVCCAFKRVPKQGSPPPIRRMLAAAPRRYDCEEKRDPDERYRSQGTKEDELDLNAQLEKPTLEAKICAVVRLNRIDHSQIAQHFHGKMSGVWAQEKFSVLALEAARVHFQIYKSEQHMGLRAPGPYDSGTATKSLSCSMDLLEKPPARGSSQGEASMSCIVGWGDATALNSSSVFWGAERVFKADGSTNHHLRE